MPYRKKGKVIGLLLVLLLITIFVLTNYKKWIVNSEIKKFQDLTNVTNESDLKNKGFTINLENGILLNKIPKIDEFFKGGFFVPDFIKFYGRFPELTYGDKVQKNVLYATIIFRSPQDGKFITDTLVFWDDGKISGLNSSQKYLGAMTMKFNDLFGLYLVPEQTSPDKEVNFSDFIRLYQYKIQHQ